MTHADLTAQELLAELPPKARAALQTAATRRRVPMTTLIKEGLIKVAGEINAETNRQRRRPQIAAAA